MSDPSKFECKYCNKAFSRNDLLARHQRRCSGSTNTTRQSKQKACAACVRTKSKCSLSQPTCDRCAQREETCEYPPKLGSPSARSKKYAMSSTTHSPTNSRDGPSYVEDNGSDMQGGITMSGTSVLNWNSDIPSVYDDFWLQMDETPSGTGSTAFQQDNIIVVQEDRMQEDRMQPFSAQRFAIDQDVGPAKENEFSFQYDSNARPIIQYLGYPQPPTLSISEESTFPSSRALSTTQPPSLSPTTMDFSTPLRQSRLESVISQGTPNPLVYMNFCHNSLTQIVKSYAQLLQTDSYRSPFIHSELFYGSHENMSSLQNSSMAICSSVAVQSKRSRMFVKNAISAERDRLVHQFHSYSCMEEWDALHAVCVYQIISLLEIDRESDWKSGVNASWLHIPFLLKMTRRFRDNHTQSMSWDPPQDGMVEETNNQWREWIVDETVRRTIFLVHCINEASSYAKTGKSPYYEGLDDTYLLDMPLPAPRAIWEANNAEAWNARKEELHWSEDKVILRNLLRGEDGLESYDIGTPGVGDSKELAGLVVACGFLAGWNR